MNCKLIAVSKPMIPECETAEDLVAYCARVSNPANQANKDTAGKLVKYLIENEHWSPLEMAHVVIEIQTSRDIARQILRHRSFSFQEFSQRYSSEIEFANPREARLQDHKNRQNSIEVNDEKLQVDWWNVQLNTAHQADAAYNWALEQGIAKEVARSVLPEGLTTSRLYMSGTLRSWIHYVQLRSGNETQKEHREIALACRDILMQEFPEIGEILIPDPLEEAVNDFGRVLLKHLRLRAKQGKSGWQEDDWEDACLDKMQQSALEDDPLDTAGYAMFAHYHGWGATE